MTDVERNRSLLGVDGSASLEELKHAYRAQMRRVHPDLGHDADTTSLTAIREAYDHLVSEWWRSRAAS